MIFITARDSIHDRVEGLDLGANDYLVKPFSLEELSARIRAQLRKQTLNQQSILTWGDLQLDTQAKVVLCAGKTIDLTAKEFQILRKLMVHPEHIITRDQLEEALYAWGEEIESNAIEVLFTNFERKSEAAVLKPYGARLPYGRLKMRSNRSSLQSQLVKTTMWSSIVVGLLALSLLTIFSIYHNMSVQDEIMDEISDTLLVSDLSKHSMKQFDELSDEFDIQYELLDTGQVLTHSHTYQHELFEKGNLSEGFHIFGLMANYGVVWLHNKKILNYKLKFFSLSVHALKRY